MGVRVEKAVAIDRGDEHALVRLRRVRGAQSGIVPAEDRGERVGGEAAAPERAGERGVVGRICGHRNKPSTGPAGAPTSGNRRQVALVGLV